MCFFAQCMSKLLALLEHPMYVLGLLDKLLGYLCKLLSCVTQMLSRHGIV